jgi:hypothetical protein
MHIFFLFLTEKIIEIHYLKCHHAVQKGKLGHLKSMKYRVIWPDITAGTYLKNMDYDHIHIEINAFLFNYII